MVPWTFTVTLFQVSRLFAVHVSVFDLFTCSLSTGSKAPGENGTHVRIQAISDIGDISNIQETPSPRECLISDN